MQPSTDEQTAKDQQQAGLSVWRLTVRVCTGVIATSVFACVIMAALRSTGLTQITVTALDEAAEPRDHNLPLVKQNEALPDYELIVLLSNGETVQLGAKPDMSAANGLTWRLSDPVSTADIASVRLREQDKLVSDEIAEVQVQGDSTTEKGYRFDFTTERSLSVGIKSFFDTPIGQAIVTGFCIAVVVIVVVLFFG